MKLIKNAYTTKAPGKFIDKSFNELKTKTESVSLSNFFDTYKKLFYRIPKSGTLSHTTMFNRSGEFLKNPQLASDKEIEKLKDQILKLKEQISKLELEKSSLEVDNKAKEHEITILKEE